MENNVNKPKVVILGADNYNTLGVLRSLAIANLDITFVSLGKKHSITTASKYCKKYYISASEDDAINYLINHYPEQVDESSKAVIVTGGDGASLACAKNYCTLRSRFHLMCTSNPKTLINVTDKNEMGRIALEAGLRVPLSQEYHPGDTDIIVPYPIILKPVHIEGRTEFKTRTINNFDQLKNFSKYLNPNNTYILQQFIDRTFDVVIYGCRLPDGTLHLAGHHTLERWSDDGGGSYGHLSPYIPEYIDQNALSRFFDIIDYHGLFSAEYGVMDNKAYFYEVNLRNDGFCHLSFQAGANLPLLWVQSCLGLPLTASPKMTSSVVGINEIYDIINVWRGKISRKQYKKDLKEARAFHFYDPNDLRPYKHMRRRMFWEIPFRAFLKKYRPFIVKALKSIGH